jgi:GR25 family glycosyltransferase involved in LPS biosynthesis
MLNFPKNLLTIQSLLILFILLFWHDNGNIHEIRLNSLFHTLITSAEDPSLPDILQTFEIGIGPWTSIKVNSGSWRKDTNCNPYSGRCSCLRKWGILPDECAENATIKPVVLEASGWMTDWPYLPGIHRCQRSVCDVRHGHTSDSRTHARLFSIIDASVQKADANGAIMVVVAMESRSRFPLHNTLKFKHFFDIGVSYHNNLSIQVSYNNYLPRDFSNPGVPFDQKRNSLVFMHSNCRSTYRNELFDKISQMIPVDALGSCKNNANVETILPQCRGLPHSGDTVWSESECILHHYKFYLAIENSRDEDYVTEKLYQGLRSGSVPIYYGAPNIRDYLPHPDSVLLIEDFDSLDSLVDYIKRASSDEILYAKHMAWKSLKLPDQFMDQVATRPVDSIFCKTCDLIATKYGDGVGPVAGAKGDGLVLPWCIVRSLRANPKAILRQWHVPEKSIQSDSNLQTYVLSIKNASNRHQFMTRQLNLAHLQADLVIGFDVDVIETNLIACWRPNSTLSTRTNQPILGPKVLSLAMKHIMAVWDIWQQGFEYALVLEDDAELALSFSDDVSAALQEAPSDWDMIVVGTCWNFHTTDERKRVSQHLFLPAFPTRCTHAILWSYSGARKLLSSLPIHWAMDYHINFAATEGKWITYWMEPAVSFQTDSFSSLLESERNEQ